MAWLFSASATPPGPAQGAGAPPAWLVVLALVLLGAALVVGGRSLDSRVFLALQSATTAVPDVFWAAWSVLGLGLSAALLAALVPSRTMAPVATMLWSLLVGGLAVQLLKHAWALPRPLAVLPPESVHVIGLHLRAGSMPSGHSAMIAVLACAVAREAWPRLRALIPVIVVLGVLGCVARVAVGAHWASDVLAGAGIGVLSVAIGDVLDARWSLRRWLATRRGRQLFAVVQLVAAVVLLATDTGYPSALAVQWLLGLASIVSAAVRWRDATREPAPVAAT